MNDFWREAKKKLDKFQKEHQSEIDQMKRNSQKMFDSAKKTGFEMDDKMRIEREFFRQKTRRFWKNQSLDNMHFRWMQFRDKHLTTSADTLLTKMKEAAQASKEGVQKLGLEKYLNESQKQLENRGINMEFLRRGASRGWGFAQSGWRSIKNQMNDRNLTRFFYTPLNYIGSSIKLKGRKLFIGALLLSFFYGAGSYLPGAVKDYYVQKNLLDSYKNLQQQQQHLLEQKRNAHQQQQQSQIVQKEQEN